MRNAWRDKPDHVTAQFTLHWSAGSILPVRANISGIESDSELGAIVTMLSPCRAVLVRRVDAVTNPLLPNVVLWGRRVKTCQKMLGRVHKANGPFNRVPGETTENFIISITIKWEPTSNRHSRGNSVVLHPPSSASTRTTLVSMRRRMISMSFCSLLSAAVCHGIT
jgi:hypothetical protein